MTNFKPNLYFLQLILPKTPPFIIHSSSRFSGAEIKLLLRTGRNRADFHCRRKSPIQEKGLPNVHRAEDLGGNRGKEAAGSTLCISIKRNRREIISFLCLSSDRFVFQTPFCTNPVPENCCWVGVSLYPIFIFIALLADNYLDVFVYLYQEDDDDGTGWLAG